MSDSRKIIEKADTSVSQLTSDGGYLSPEKFDQFFDVLMDGPHNMINQARTVTMSGPQKDIDKIGMNSRMLRPAPSSGSTLNADQRYRPQFSQVSLNTKKFMGEVFLPYDVLEDNIERGNLEQTIINKSAQRIRKDLSELLVLGDTSSEDLYLQTTDGVFQLAGHQIDGSGISAIDKSLFELALKAMPDKYLEDKESMGFWVSPTNELNYHSNFAARETAGGDASYTTSPMAPPIYGIKVMPEYRVPNSDLLLTFAQNIILGIQRDVTLRTEEEPRADGVTFVWTVRLDIQLEESDATVRVKNISV